MVDDYEPKTLEERKQKSIDYVGSAKFLLMYNFEQFDGDSYGKNTIKKSSKIERRQFSSLINTFTRVEIKVNEVDDEVNWFNLG